MNALSSSLFLTMAAVSLHAADHVIPSPAELRTNPVIKLVIPPEQLREQIFTYSQQNPSDPAYFEKLAEALEKNQEVLSGILARQQQILTQMKAQDPTPPPPEVPQPSPAAPPPPSPVPTANQPPSAPPIPQNPELPPTAQNQPEPLAQQNHRLLIDLEFSSRILFKIHTNAPAATPPKP